MSNTLVFPTAEPTSERGSATHWADFLAEIPWTALATLTFRHSPSPAWALRAAEGWAARMEKEVESGMPYCGAIETSPHVHVHALLALPHRRFVEQLVDREWPHGLVQVHERIGPGAVRYMARKIPREEHLIMPSNLRTRARKLRWKTRYLERRQAGV